MGYGTIAVPSVRAGRGSTTSTSTLNSGSSGHIGRTVTLTALADSFIHRSSQGLLWLLRHTVV